MSATFDLGAVPTGLDLAGTFVFAVSGALVAVRGRLDLFGTLVLAGATGLGGGLVSPHANFARLVVVPVRASQGGAATTDWASF